MKTQDDEEYCRALAWALYKGKCPMTVGLYVPWGRCRDIILKRIKETLYKISNTDGNRNQTPHGETTPREECCCVIQEEGSENNPDERMELLEHHLKKSDESDSRKLTVKELLKLVFLLLFYDLITKKQDHTNRRHNVFITFTALHCTGCDYLWAGLVTALCDGIEDEFGRIPISIYRAMYKEEEITADEKSKQCKVLHSPEEWAPKQMLRVPVLFVTLFVLLILTCALLLKFVLYDNLGESEEYDSITDYIFYIALAMCGGSSLLFSGMAFKVIRNVIVTQKGKLMQKMKRTDMSSQLGFMSDVKKEIEIITSYLRMMEIYRKQEIRVIIEVTNLDKCLPDRVVEVLHAVDILLSNPDAPFICILAVDPGIIVECAEKSHLLKGMANNGYLFLNRIVTLPFSIPQMSHHTKANHLDNIIGDRAEPSENNENYEINNQEQEVIDPEDPEDAIKKALQSMKSKECEFINDNVINMRRIVNTIGITIRLMIKDAEWNKIRFKVPKWVIMAAQWPCSLSWILQCIEDEQQSAKELQKAYLEKRLWDIYEMSLEALHANRKSLKQLLELDGDPDIFSKLLKDSKFTVKDANILRKFTVNLDPTIQRKIELLQGSFNFLRFKKDKTVSRLALLEMDTDAVCKEIGKLNIPEKKLKKYISMIEKHRLNGKALLYTDNKEIRKALGMTLGDWVTFRAAFLSLPTPTFLL